MPAPTLWPVRSGAGVVKRNGLQIRWATYRGFESHPDLSPAGNPGSPAGRPPIAPEADAMPDADPLLQAQSDIRLGKHGEAVQKLTALLADYPDIAGAHDLLACALISLGQQTQDMAMQRRALDHARLAVQYNPDSREHRITLAGLLSFHRLVIDAIDAAYAWRARMPDDADAYLALGAALMDAGRYTQAREVYLEALARWPNDYQMACNLAQLSIYDPSLTPRERLEFHRRAGSLLPPLTQPPKHSNPPEPDRKLRVGFISADFRRHSCAYFIEPLLRHLDRARIDPILYHTYHVEDSVTARLKPLAKIFRRMPAAGATSGLGFQLWNDRVDVLFDLSGHTPGNRLPVFAGRPVPVQATYLGYPGTTGSPGIDFRFVDSTTDPPGAEADHTEELVRLDPCFLCFQPDADAPEPRPRDPGAPLTFVSFNNIVKLNDPTLSLWTRVIHAVPGSRLVLKNFGFEDARLRADVASRFIAAGLPADRLELAPGQLSTAEHAARYHDADIALDPLVYNGTTTTCEALWMGVPVVTTTGDTHASRVGATLLRAVGLTDLIAPNPDAYVRLAAALADDAPRRAHLRASLRERMRASTLCDGPGFAARFEAAVRSLWRRWCESRRA